MDKKELLKSIINLLRIEKNCAIENSKEVSSATNKQWFLGYSAAMERAIGILKHNLK
jgi:hypothetical protein